MSDELRRELRVFYEREGDQDCQVALYESHDWVHNRLKQIVLGWTMASTDPESVILDAGCAEGMYLRFLASSIRKGIGIDLSSRKIERAQRYAGQSSNLHFAVASLEDLPLPSSFFDVVLTIETVEHVPDAQRALKEVIRVLKQGGVFICSVPTELDERLAGYKRDLSWREKSGHLHSFGRRDFMHHLTNAGFIVDTAQVVDVFGPSLRHLVSMSWPARMVKTIFGWMRDGLRPATDRRPPNERIQPGRQSRQEVEKKNEDSIGMKLWPRVDERLSNLPLVQLRASYCVFRAIKLSEGA